MGSAKGVQPEPAVTACTTLKEIFTVLENLLEPVQTACHHAANRRSHAALANEMLTPVAPMAMRIKPGATNNAQE